MDSQFKQRLTGAVILVLLAVLLVPEMLTGPKSTAPGPTALPAQAEGAPLRSYDIDLSDSRDAAAPATTPELPAARVLASRAVTSGADERAASPPPAERASTPGAAAETGRDLTLERAAVAGATSPVAMRGFAVQVGSFASRASADRLAADLKRRRFDVFIAPVQSGGRQLFRVRVGPAPDRAAAQAIAVRLKAAGRSGTVVPLS